MKQLSILTLIITAFLISSNTGCNPESVDPATDTTDVDAAADAALDTENDNLGLVYMREEEKLARDVYITLFGMYENKVFDNISKAEQQHRMVPGRSYVVFIFLSEKTNRIVASSKLDKFLSSDSPGYTEGEEVDLIPFEKTDMGYRALINRTHAGMIYSNEVFQQLEIGQRECWQ